MNIEDFRSAGVLPTGPVSAWPEERHHELQLKYNVKTPDRVVRQKKVKASALQMAAGLVGTAKNLATRGIVAEEVREQRYETCKSCPAFIADSKRCSECGCYMEAKTWVNARKDKLCPLDKWKR